MTETKTLIGRISAALVPAPPAPVADTLRLSDVERNDAMNQLARAVGEGRLTIEEFEERSDDIMAARFRRDLVPVFQDIPALPLGEVKEYSREEIERLRQRGRKPRLATALLTTLFAGVAAPFFVAAGFSANAEILGVGAGLLTMLLIPTVWIALYVLKLGPAEWHMPSVKQLERERRRAARAELTSEAFDLARNRISKWNSGRM
ncbi:MAG: DUF1707 domain-containing protein [Corynebacterium sp.]|nr:DUF1707 domain-containing protein [Corynebacterium sp.]